MSTIVEFFKDADRLIGLRLESVSKEGEALRIQFTGGSSVLVAPEYFNGDYGIVLRT